MSCIWRNAQADEMDLLYICFKTGTYIVGKQMSWRTFLLLQDTQSKMISSSSLKDSSPVKYFAIWDWWCFLENAVTTTFFSNLEDRIYKMFNIETY